MDSYSYSNEDKLLAMLCHASAICLPVILPLILLLLKNDSAFVHDHAREALIFHIGMVVAEFISALLLIVLVGFLLIPFFFILYVVCTIIAVIRAYHGQPYHYPVTTHIAQKI
mgnify:CR=1 FL=1